MEADNGDNKPALTKDQEQELREMKKFKREFDKQEKYLSNIPELMLDSMKANRRLVIGGNTGGAVAAIGLFGAALGNSGENRGPTEAIFVLAIFLFGLCLGGGSHWLWAKTARINLRMRDALAPLEGSDIPSGPYLEEVLRKYKKRKKRWDDIKDLRSKEKWYAKWSLIVMICGIAGGLVLMAIFLGRWYLFGPIVE